MSTATLVHKIASILFTAGWLAFHINSSYSLERLGHSRFESWDDSLQRFVKQRAPAHSTDLARYSLNTFVTFQNAPGQATHLPTELSQIKPTHETPGGCRDCDNWHWEKEEEKRKEE